MYLGQAGARSAERGFLMTKPEKIPELNAVGPFARQSRILISRRGMFQLYHST